MASSILNQIYKEAAVTSKGVVQMNRTLNKVYDDQEKSNKRQIDKFTKWSIEQRGFLKYKDLVEQQDKYNINISG